MKVLLVNPNWDGYISRRGHRLNRAWPPLDLLNCAALLEKEGIQADLADTRAFWMSPEDLARKSRDYDQVFVTSSPLDRWQCPNLEIDLFFERLKPLHHPQLYIMGVHGTHFPQAVLDNTSARAVIQGEPEWAVLDIARGTPLENVQGLVHRDGPRGVSNSPRPLSDLTQFPVPAFHLLNFDGYGYELLGDHFVLLESTRGCPFPCNFCQREIYGGRAYRYKSPDQVIQEVEAALEAGARNGYFIDLEFSLNRDFVLKLCAGLMRFRSRWKWGCQTRADAVDPELLAVMREAGCRLIHFGVETGSDKIMKEIGKKITLDQVANGVAITKKAGIEVACFFLMGFPGETEADRERSLEFAKKISPTYVSFGIVSPYPGTPLRNTGQWKELYPESILEGEELAKLKRWRKKAFQRYYLRWDYMLERLVHGNVAQLWQQAKLYKAMA